MRLLLDECVPRRFVAELADPEVRHISDMGWAGVKNGELLRLMSEAGFMGLVTTDRSISWQQSIAQSPLFLVVLRASSNRIADLRPLMPELTRLLAFAQPGQVYIAGA